MNKEELHELLHPMKLIGLGGNQTLAKRIAKALNKELLETAVTLCAEALFKASKTIISSMKFSLTGS